MALMEINIVPLGTKSVSVSRYVTKAANVLEKEKVKYSLTSMGTIVQAGSVKELLAIAEKMHKTVFDGNVKRVVTDIKIDQRRDKEVTIEGKVGSVRNKMDRKQNIKRRRKYG